MALTYGIGPPPTPRGANSATPPANAMASPWNRTPATAPPPPQTAAEPQSPSSKAAPATETIGRRAGSFTDEIDFPAFVASLIHGTFDAIVDASIRQMD